MKEEVPAMEIPTNAIVLSEATQIERSVASDQTDEDKPVVSESALADKPVMSDEHKTEQPKMSDSASTSPGSSPRASPRTVRVTATRASLETGIQPPEDWEEPDDLEWPTSASCWSRFERDLFEQSDGVYDASRMAERRRIQTVPIQGAQQDTGFSQEVRGRVSIVTPTTDSRQHYHEQLWACFLAQDWPDKELVVVETYETAPSAFLKQKAQEDRRLVLVSFQRDEDEDFNVGLKRNMTLHLASGEFIVNFDDDDIYAACYCTRMVEEMQEKGLSALTLSAWHNYFVRNGVCGYSNERCWNRMTQEELDEIWYGYGFSYVHKRHLSLIFPYPNFDFAEDAPFFLKLRKVLGDSKVGLKQDKDGICMHMMHRANSTGECEYARKLSQPELVDLEVASLPLFQQHLERQVNSCWSLPIHPLSAWRWGGAGVPGSACL